VGPLRPDRPGHVAWLAIGGGLLLGLALGLILFASPDPISNPAAATTSASMQAPIVGSLAPDFELETVDGDTIRLSDLRGKVVALNFWATWCAPCRLEMPDLQDRADAFGDRLAVVGVDFDETAEEVDAFARRSA
jgi:cytochrome oxidase Cu insertion factor (SCO1/SenC/PrrC family)